MLHAIEGESFHQLVEREDLTLGPWIPPEEGEVIEHRLRQIALVAIQDEVGLRVLALRQLASIGSEDQGHVGECLRTLIAQRIADEQLVRRVGKVLFATDDMRDRHRRVVDRTCEVVGRIPVRFHDDEVTEQARVEGHLAAHHVGELDLLCRYLKPHRELFAAFRWIVQTASRVDVRPLFQLRLLALCVELLRSAVAPIGLPGLQQPRGMLFVEVEPL